MMKLKNYIIEGIYQSIEEIKTVKPDLPFSAWLSLNKNKVAITPIIEAYAQKKEDLINKYAQKDENGKVITKHENGRFMTTIENMADYSKDLSELQSEEVELSLEKIKRTSIDSNNFKAFDSIFYFIEYLTE